jgi:signal transduction histidine kinase/DNA-binding response OmpR family regulator
MSKKRLRSRLDNLFSTLGDDGVLQPAEPGPQDSPFPISEPTTSESDSVEERDVSEESVPAIMTGWTWEIDANLNYVSCGMEVSDALRMNPHAFLGQSVLVHGLHPASRSSLETALRQDIYPIERNVLFEASSGDCIPVRMHILGRIEAEGTTTGWRGYAQRIPEAPVAPPTPQEPVNGKNRLESAAGEIAGVSEGIKATSHTDTPEPDTGMREESALTTSKPQKNGKARIEPAPKPAPNVEAPAPSGTIHGYAYQQGGLGVSKQIWTETGQQSLVHNKLLHADASPQAPAAMAVPLKMQGVGDLLLEIVDDTEERAWLEDERQLVMEIAAQLALALDNAKLYQSVQLELAERIRAEQTILRRNRDLATLNKIGQQLSRLASRDEIFELLAMMIHEVLEPDNLIICAFNANKQTLSYPVSRVGGKELQLPETAFQNGIAEYAIKVRKPLLISQDAGAELTRRGIDLPQPVPASLLAIPMIAGDRSVGAVVVLDNKHTSAFDEIHLELLSTAVSQATTALENADLFQQMQNALETLENRERYQSSVARAAATLTEFGAKSMPEVLKTLGQAAQCSRVYFAQVTEDDRGVYWSAAGEWIDPAVAYLFDKTKIQHLPSATYINWGQALRENGWVEAHSSDQQSAESELLSSQHIRSTLLLAVPGASTTPSFLAFDQLGSERRWQNEEIGALRVAADAISNTFVREGLLEQLQVTLDETEGLYKASNRLALANDMQEMVSAVLSSVRSPEINRAVLLLFEYDQYGKITQITVNANWYSGRGAPPPPVGTEYLRSRYERFLQTDSPIFFDDISDAAIEKGLQENLLHQKIRALAILPVWSGKRQIGVLLLQSENQHVFTGRETRTYPPLVDQMGISVENQRLFDQTQKALSETELLYDVSNRIAQAAGAKEMLELVVNNLLPTGAERASLMLIESDTNGELIDIEIVGFHDKNDYQRMGVHLPISALPMVKSLTDEPLIIPDIQQFPLDPASRETLEQFHIIASCIVPLRTGGRLMGLLSTSARHPAAFNQEETRLLRIAGNGIAVALEKQRLLRQAQRRALELQTASEIARDTASTLSLDLLLNRIVNMLGERFGFYNAALYLLDETRTYAVIREATGNAGQEMKARNYRLAVGSRTVVGSVAASGESFILNDVHNNPMYQPNTLLPETRSEMGVPLNLGQTVIGVLDLQSREINAFNQDDVTVLKILADQIAIAIENARAYELSQRAIENMREIDRVKSQFLANMSHELRTPLNSIIGFSRVILKGIDGPINDTQKQDLSAIYNSGQHLLSLINDILDLSKIEAGKMELAFSEINLHDLVNSAMSTAVGLVKDKPIRLNTVLAENLPNVRADNTRVRQILINFLSNAAKFTDEGSITVEVTQVTSPTGKPEAMIAVTDTGPGIPKPDQAKLFLPFSQVDDSPTRKSGGTGLGLSICRSLIEMHGGRIGLLRSEVGVGSTFFFTLPAIIPEPVEPLVLISNTVLCIDDDLRVISLYERYLKPHGYHVVPLTDPKQAVEAAKKVRPFAVTLDIMMPEKDGWQVMHDLRQCPETRNIPIIICSILENQEQGFSMGAADYLVKPFLQEDLINSINRLNYDGQINEILVIDDDVEDLRLVRKMMDNNQHFKLTTVQGGKNGWEAIQNIRPDAIILDLFMPEMNGFMILEKLRANPELRSIPVVILTGADLEPDQHKQLTEFSEGVLAKGYLREKELLVLLEDALRKFHPAPKDGDDEVD